MDALTPSSDTQPANLSPSNLWNRINHSLLAALAVAGVILCTFGTLGYYGVIMFPMATYMIPLALGLACFVAIAIILLTNTKSTHTPRPVIPPQRHQARGDETANHV